MRSSKLILYLSTFSKQDLRLFKDFVNSPYFNKHTKTKDLLDHLLKLKTWDSPQLDKEKIFRKVFPKQVYDEQLLRTVMSYLVQLVYRFYSQKQYETKNNEQQINRLELALQQGQQKMFEHHCMLWEKNMEKSPIRDSTYFSQFSRVQRLRDNFDIKHRKRTSGDFLKLALTNFDTYYIREKLRMSCEMLARKQVTGQEYSFPLLHELIALLESQPAHFKAIPGIWVYFLVYKMITDGHTSHFFELKERLKTETVFFKYQEGRDLYTHALNYTIGKLNFGEIIFRKDAFELYQEMLNNDLLFVENRLPQWDFINIVSLGCGLEEKEWTKKFILEQKQNLPDEERENTFTYSLAAYHYSLNEYSEAIVLLQKVAFTEVYYNLLTRILMLKIYFETKNTKALEYVLETFRIFLLRNKEIGGDRRKSGLHLIKYTRVLSRLIAVKRTIPIKEFEEKWNKIADEIRSNKKVLNKSWLLQKLEEGV